MSGDIGCRDIDLQTHWLPCDIPAGARGKRSMQRELSQIANVPVPLGIPDDGYHLLYGQADASFALGGGGLRVGATISLSDDRQRLFGQIYDGNSRNITLGENDFLMVCVFLEKSPMWKMKIMLKQCSLILLAIGIAACQPTPTSGQLSHAPAAQESPLVLTKGQSGDAPSTRGFGFVQAACADCHAVQPPALSPNPQAPPFADIANRKGLTAKTLSAWLRDAHNYPEAMDFDLDSSQADDLTAYLLTLRDPNYEPPIY